MTGHLDSWESWYTPRPCESIRSRTGTAAPQGFLLTYDQNRDVADLATFVGVDRIE